MLIHETDFAFSSNIDPERCWTEWTTIGIVAAVGCLCFVAVRGIVVNEFADEPDELEAANSVVTQLPNSTSKDPNWEPSDEIVFHGVYRRVGVFVKGVSDKGGCALGSEIEVKKVHSGRLGVKRLRCKPPTGVKFDQVYAFRWKPSSWAKEDLKSARKNGFDSVSLLFWDSVELVENVAPKT